ncbi:cytochrome P450 [Xylariales sp. PMI_506]|nr:cytochrome P450 [Xylariales sp. PMI_506]
MYSLALCAVIFFLFVRFVRAASQPGLAGVPGPFLAKFTDLWRLYKVWNWTFKQDLPKLHEYYNSRLIRVGPNLLSCTDPRAVEVIYGFQSQFKKSDMVKAMGPIYQGKRQPTMFAAADNKTHAAIRKPVAPAYSMSKIIQFEPFVDKNMKLFYTKLDELFISTNKPCDYHNWVQYWAFDVIFEMTMSRNLGFMEAGGDVDGVLKQLNRETDYRAISLTMPIIDRLVKWNPLNWFYKPDKSPSFALRCKQILHQRIEEQTSGAATADANRPADFTTAFLDAQVKDPSIGDGQLIGYAKANLTAGSDTISVILRTAVYYSLKQPWIAKRIVEEVDAKVKSFPVPFQVARFELPFCGAVVRESLRKHFAFIALLEREVPEGGCELPDGTKLPAGVVVGMHGDAIGLDKTIFGENADDFDPLRWLPRSDEPREDFQNRLRAMNAHDLAFGRGTRGCIGRHVAEMEIYKFVPTFFGLLEARLVRPDDPWQLRQLFVFKQSGMDMYLNWRGDKNPATLNM